MARILVIDDDVAVLNSIGLLIKTEGYEPVLERDGDRAIRLINSEKFDLIITDIKMEPVDGMEVLMFAHKAQPTTPIIIVSAITSEETAKLGYSLGCKAYVKKPFKVREVVDAIRETIAASAGDQAVSPGEA